MTPGQLPRRSETEGCAHDAEDTKGDHRVLVLTENERGPGSHEVEKGQQGEYKRREGAQHHNHSGECESPMSVHSVHARMMLSRERSCHVGVTVVPCAVFGAGCVRRQVVVWVFASQQDVGSVDGRLEFSVVERPSASASR